MTGIAVHLAVGVIGGLATLWLDSGKRLGPAFMGWVIGIVTVIAAQEIIKVL